MPGRASRTPPVTGRGCPQACLSMPGSARSGSGGFPRPSAGFPSKSGAVEMSESERPRSSARRPTMARSRRPWTDSGQSEAPAESAQPCRGELHVLRPVPAASSRPLPHTKECAPLRGGRLDQTRTARPAGGVDCLAPGTTRNTWAGTSREWDQQAAGVRVVGQPVMNLVRPRGRPGIPSPHGQSPTPLGHAGGTPCSRPFQIDRAGRINVIQLLIECGKGES